MLLRKVKLENFKRFKELEREFGPGINVVKGPLNEIGKSTLLDGIVAALFDNPKSTSKELERYTTWGSNRRCKTSVEFDAENTRYVIEKDFDKKTIRLAALDTDEEWDLPRDISEKIRRLLGTNSSTLFLSTSCIRQNEVTDISSGRKEIGESLEGIVTGGTEETVASQVVDKLDKQIGALRKGLERPTRSPGAIARLTEQVNNLQQKLAEVREEVAKAEEQKTELIEVSRDLGQVEVKLTEAQALLEKNKRRQQVEEAIGKLEKEYERIDGLIHDIGLLKEQIQGAEAALQSVEGFSDVHKVMEVKSRLPVLEANRRSVSDDLPKRRRELETAVEHLKSNRLLAGLASRTSLVLGAVVSVAGFAGMFFDTASLAAGIIGLVFLVGAMWARSSLTQQKTQISDLKGRVGRMEQALNETEEQRRQILSQVSCASIQEFAQKEQKHSELVEKKKASQSELVGRLGAETPEQIEQQRLGAARMLAEERAKLTDDLSSTRLSPEEYVRREKEVQDLGVAKKQLESSKMRCEVGINSARFDSEDQAQMEERLDSLANALSREEKKARVYQLARDFVSRARAETLVSASDVLQRQIQKDFEIFTNGKYKKVIVGEGSVDFHIYSEEKCDWVRPNELSGGVVDEFYLACRLALVRLIYGEAQPPLILDDPFGNFDEPRLASTLEFLGKVSEEQQIIIFTLSDAYDDIADRVIRLT